MLQETTLLSALRGWPLHAPNIEKLQIRFPFVAALIFLLQRRRCYRKIGWGGEEEKAVEMLTCLGPVDFTLFWVSNANELYSW